MLLAVHPSLVPPYYIIGGHQSVKGKAYYIYFILLIKIAHEQANSINASNLRACEISIFYTCMHRLCFLSSFQIKGAIDKIRFEWTTLKERGMSNQHNVYVTDQCPITYISTFIILLSECPFLRINRIIV